jgi:hypothetical protein
MTAETYSYAANLPVLDDVDVLVVGGGPTGIAAAVATARGGVKTRLIERYGYLGGNLTAGLVGPCMTSFSLDGRQQLIQGIFEEFVAEMVSIGGAIHPSEVPAGSAYCSYIDYGHDKVTPFQPEAAKIVAQRMCIDAGVDLLFYTMAVDALTVESASAPPRAAGVVCAAKGGLCLQRAKVIVDCSADGDIAAFSGAQTHYGRASDGLVQPLTMFFRVQNVDDEVVEAHIKSANEVRPFSSIVERARDQGRFPVQRRGIGLYKTLEPGVWRINTGRVLKLDGSQAADLTKAEIQGREQTVALIKFFREDLPGFENCSLLDTAAQIGVRETRRIEGEYTLTLEDLQEGRNFPDTIALCAYPVDIHDPTGAGGGLDHGLGPTANIYQIPYRVMVPKNLDGLLVSGRAVSATHEALGAIRVMPPCFALGQAAGVAARLAVQSEIAPRKVGYNVLRSTLVSEGVYLGAGNVD